VTPGPGWPGLAGLFHLACFGLLLPIGAAVTRRHLATGDLPPKKRFLLGAAAQQIVLLTISLWVATRIGVDLLPPYRFSIRDIAALVVILGVLIPLAWRGWRRHLAEGDRIATLITPVDRTDHALWALLSLLAGIGEEIGYRGVLFAILAGWTGEPLLAAALAAVAFGAGHLAQGWSGAALATVAALGFHALVWWTGGLYLAIAIHAAYDWIAGLAHWWLATRGPLSGWPARTLS
jgi:membrane protease YdiL (CAAX protease family)